ncbi:unnamed protein product [Mytilus edulis]|uniref:Uncharacterized protein n=1 Tax=Mytilus edulis TaxID=6550 RepID=A0A8S3T1V6_MYTED|nr:unnamed protein product [Mytilus edulis]
MFSYSTIHQCGTTKIIERKLMNDILICSTLLQALVLPMLFGDENSVQTTQTQNRCIQRGLSILLGYAGGGYYTDPGSATEYVCLPPDPDFEKTSGSDGGRMYGAEYESNFFGKDDEDVPCAVCRKIRSTSILMVPGKNKCYNGWNIEYHGYLGSGYHSHAAASSYVCVDSHPEYLNAGVVDTNGKLFYPVLAKQQQATINQQQARTIQLQQAEIRVLQSTKVLLFNLTQILGYTGDGIYSHSGSAAEYVCLPPDPDFQKTSGYYGGYNGYMYGAEYESKHFGTPNEDVPIVSQKNKFNFNLNNSC